MIAANELRIGNWVRYTIDEMVMNNKATLKEDKLVKVDSISYDFLLEKELPDSYCINHSSRRYFQPIPLTPEILEKCGFEKDRTGFSLPDKMSLSFSVDKSGRYIACWEDKSLHLPYELKHLHQLQNLYFALTNQELTYNP